MLIGFDIAAEAQHGASAEGRNYLRDMLSSASEEDLLAATRLDRGPEWPTLSRTSNANEPISTEDFVLFLKRHCDREKVPRNSALWRAIDVRQHLDLIQSIRSRSLPRTINGVYRYAWQQKIPMREPEWSIIDLHTDRATEVPQADGVRKQKLQDDELLRALRDSGYDPNNLPSGERGRPGVKSKMRKLLVTPGQHLFTKASFDHAWKRLRGQVKADHK